MVALELRETEVTRAADVVFPVAPVTDKAGTFVNWEGRPRPFEAVLRNPASLPDLRVLAGIAEELGHARSASAPSPRPAPQMAEIGPWDGERRRGRLGGARDGSTPQAATEGCGSSTWKQMIDNGSMQDGDEYLARHRPAGGRPGRRPRRTTPLGADRHRHR